MWGWALQDPLTDYWTYFESENGFEKILPLTGYNSGTGFYTPSFSLTNHGPIGTNSPSQII
jgi:hypothetical protein